jgi:GNAT superfamily N-acetyltransferase
VSETDTTQPAILRALEENLWALWSRFGRGEGCVLHETNGGLWFDTPIPTLPYNTVLRFASQGDVDAHIDRIFAHYRERGVPFMWVVHPSSRPADLGERLLARGMIEAEVCPGMWMDLADLPDVPPTPQGIEIREAAAEEDISQILELVAWRWSVPTEVRPRLAGVARAFDVGRPGSALRCWIALMDGIPVSKVIMNLDAGAAGLYGVATKPEARGLGLARTLTLVAYHAARMSGYGLGVLHSSPMALSLYEKIGFRAIAPFTIYTTSNDFHM